MQLCGVILKKFVFQKAHGTHACVVSGLGLNFGCLVIEALGTRPLANAFRVPWLQLKLIPVQVQAAKLIPVQIK